VVRQNYSENRRFLLTIARLESNQDTYVVRNLLASMKTQNPFQTLVLRFLSIEALRDVVFKALKSV